MRSVAILLIATMLAATNVMAQGQVTCPKSSAVPIGCYCTHGCSLGGDTVFPWNSARFPAPAIEAATMGNDTICAKITVSYKVLAESTALAAYLGFQGQVAVTGPVYNGVVPNTEVTIWTAMTQLECLSFASRVKSSVAVIPDQKSLHFDLCTTDKCNTRNLPVAPAPSTAVADNVATQFPGKCPAANPKPTGCYCTNGCSYNDYSGARSGFAYSPNVWPPAKVPASIVGSDTICAKITVPNINSVAGQAMAAALYVNGFIYGNTTSWWGADFGTTLTVYTAFTAAECANYVTLASSLSATLNINTTAHLCNTESCNTFSMVSATSSASSVTLMGVAAVVIAALSLF